MSQVPMYTPDEIFDTLRYVRSEIIPIDSEIYRLQQERSKSIENAVTQIGSAVLGKYVTAVKTGDVENDYTIGAYDYGNPLVIANARTRPGYARPLYVPANQPDRKDATGKVIDVDISRSSLVVKSKIPIFGSTFWIRLINSAGEQVVNLDIH